MDWNLDAEGEGMLEHVRLLTALRKHHPVFRRNDFLRGVRVEGSRGKDITWLRIDGREMAADDWTAPARAAVAFRLDGDALEGTSGRERLRDDSFLVLMNGESSATAFTAPAAPLGRAWRVVIDTRESPQRAELVSAGGPIELGPGSLVVLLLEGGDAAEELAPVRPTPVSP